MMQIFQKLKYKNMSTTIYIKIYKVSNDYFTECNSFFNIVK